MHSILRALYKSSHLRTVHVVYYAEVQSEWPSKMDTLHSTLSMSPGMCAAITNPIMPASSINSDMQCSKGYSIQHNSFYHTGLPVADLNMCVAALSVDLRNTPTLDSHNFIFHAAFNSFTMKTFSIRENAKAFFMFSMWPKMHLIYE